MNRSLFFFGDSVCFGQYVSIHRIWTSQISQRLEESFKDDEILVQVTAVNGETTREALRRIDHCVLSHVPDVVWIQYGLNDSNYWASDGGEPRVPYNEFIGNLEKIASSCLEVGTRHCLLATNHEVTKQLPHESTGDKYRQNARRYNEGIRELVSRFEESRVSLVDLEDEVSQVAKPENYLLDDGVHLNKSGHDLYAAICYPPIASVL